MCQPRFCLTCSVSQARMPPPWASVSQSKQQTPEGSITEGGWENSMNLNPSVSPDGKFLALITRDDSGYQIGRAHV